MAWFALVRADGPTPADQVVELPVDRAAERVADSPRVVVTYDDGAIVAVEVHGGSRTTYDAPWFVEVPEPAASPPASTVMVFSGHDVPAWSLRAGGGHGDPPVTGTDQLAAVRWYPRSGEVDQIYVAPQARRRGLASTLLAVAAALNEARGLPRFWGDGQRTDLGEAWRDASPWSHRAAARTHTAPPMTPQ
ncbi:GNAT family N-acetyltransferase [Marmoricola endophyticus]|uniref:GNAT family N-acetyltransferase n=1 Tax=Marmoricola endophyticus TaxID=2040280 RepID=UPI00166319EE|nr:GNAT family N-acetyltransferase [Marmoricola endophyticus]